MIAAAAEDDRLAELERTFFRYYRWEDLPKGVADDDPHIALYSEGWQETAAQIIAATAAGLRTKVRVPMLELTEGQSAYGEDLAASLLADLDRLAGEAHHA